MEYNVEILLTENSGNIFEATKQLEKMYKRGIFTEDEYLEGIDILAAKGMATGWNW